MPKLEDSRHRFYANENFPIPAVNHLRNLGHDVQTTHDVGQSNLGIPDKDVLEFAFNSKRAILTCNRRDFIRLHNSSTPKHFGIIVCSEDIDYSALAHRIHESVKCISCLSGELIRINLPSS